MGLRRRISLYLVSILSVLALLTLIVLRWGSHEKAAQQEEVEARADLHRLMSTLQARTLEVNGTLKSWANWSALYQHLLHRTTQFRQNELSVDALAVANVDFLLLLDLQGKVVDMSEVPGAQGETPVTEETQQRGYAYPGYANLSPTGRGCGAIKARSRVALVCFSPVVDSEGKGSPRGLVVIGQWLSDEMVQQVSELTGIRFSIVDVPNAPLIVKSPLVVDNVFRQELVQVMAHEHDIELRYPITSLFGNDIAQVRMSWPRRHAQLASSSYDTTQAVVIALILTCGVLLVLLLDRVVVRRLNRLREELALIVDSKRWTGEVTVSGHDEMAALARYAQELVAVVRHQVQELKNLSQTDALTGLPNRRAFNERLEHMLAQYARQQLPAALILMDVDFFKKYNDSYGHPAGDEALQKVAQCLRSCLRRELDLPARLGGEEFGVLLLGVSAEQAVAVAEQIRAYFQGMGIAHRANLPLGVMTMSLGVAAVSATDTTTSLYRRADAALYQAKTQGRNRVNQA